MFDIISRHRSIQVKGSDTKWNWSFSSLILFLGKKKADIADWT